MKVSLGDTVEVRDADLGYMRGTVLEIDEYSWVRLRLDGPNLRYPEVWVKRRYCKKPLAT